MSFQNSIYISVLQILLNLLIATEHTFAGITMVSVIFQGASTTPGCSIHSACWERTSSLKRQERKLYNWTIFSPCRPTIKYYIYISFNATQSVCLSPMRWFRLYVNRSRGTSETMAAREQKTVDHQQASIR